MYINNAGNYVNDVGEKKIEFIKFLSYNGVGQSAYHI